jgi:hypothetical protein
MAAAPTRDDAKAYTGEPQTKTDKLAAFRDPAPSGDQMPEPFNENAEPVEAAAPPPPALEPEKKDPNDAVPMRRDPRAEIAQRARERRDAEAKETVETFGDLNAPPVGVGEEGQQQPVEAVNDNQGNDNLAIGNDNREPAPEPKTYTLKVNRQEYPVSRDDLIRYAGLSPEEAVGIPDLSLVRAAQMNIAAEQRLAEAKQANAYRPAAPDALPHQGEDQRHVAPQAEQRQPALDIKSAVQKIQLGDEEEAAQALLETVSALTSEQLAQQRAADRMSQVQSQIESDLNSFARENPDILNDDVMQAAHRNLIVQEALTDLARIPGVTREHVMQAMNNPAHAMQLYQAAVADGYAIRPPAEIFNAAAGKLRARFAPPAPSHADPQQPDPRTVAKRGLIQQPAHNDNGNQNPAPQQQNARRSYSDTIQQMRRWRNQTSY